MTQVIEGRSAQPSPAMSATDAERTDVCLVCLEDCKGLLPVCHEGHAVCGVCAGNMARHFVAEAASGRLMCPAGPAGACRGEAIPELAVIALAANGKGSAAEVGVLMRALTAAEAGAAEQRGRCAGAEEARRAVDEANSVDEAVRLVREEVLVDRCPRCKAAFADWDGCNALSCAACGAAFCAVCLEDCGADAHLHVVRTHGELFDKPGAERAREARRRDGVRRVLDALAATSRPHAEELLQQELQDLSLAEPAAATVRPCGPEQLKRRARRMVRELEELREYFASGRGAFDPIRRTEEQVVLVWDQRDKLHVLDVQVWGYGSPELQEARKEELTAQFGLTTFGKTETRVAVQRQPRAGFRGRAETETRVVEVQRHGPAGFRVTPEDFTREKDVHLGFIMAFSREQRALTACQGLLGGGGDSGGGKALEVLLRGAPNGEALMPGARVAIGAADDDFDAPLNAAQRCTLAQDETRVVQLVHGPPGTGKTSVIDRLIRSPASQRLWLKGAKQRHAVVVLSEKNLAVDAVAASLLRRGGGTPKHQVWEETIAHGASGSLGENAKRFLLKRKVLEDPAVTAAQLLVNETNRVKQGKSTALELAVQEHFSDIARACTGERVVKLDKLDATGKEILITLKEAPIALRGEYEKLAVVASEVLPRSTDSRLLAAKAAIAAASEALRVAQQESDRTEHELATAKKAAEERLTKSARVVLSTLGSAHGVLGAVCGHVDSDGEVEVSLTVICDEASTVHTALFVGAIQGIGAHVTNIIVIGDDRQLPPYWPVQDGELQPRSLFDDARDATDAVFLSHQYRVPRCVMCLLNKHFYTDTPLVYAKLTDANDCARPLWIHVRPDDAAPAARGNFNAGGRGRGDASASRTETSAAEARAAVTMAAQEAAAGRSVMLITPYRQQRDLLRDLLQEELGAAAAEVTVCTVDGAQGQEADVVIISLVKAKPSRFLDKRRLCVMLSRARRTLVLVGDRGSHSNCQCAPLAEVARLSEQAPAQ